MARCTINHPVNFAEMVAKDIETMDMNENIKKAVEYHDRIENRMKVITDLAEDMHGVMVEIVRQKYNGKILQPTKHITSTYYLIKDIIGIEFPLNPGKLSFRSTYDMKATVTRMIMCSGCSETDDIDVSFRLNCNLDIYDYKVIEDSEFERIKKNEADFHDMDGVPLNINDNVCFAKDSQVVVGRIVRFDSDNGTIHISCDDAGCNVCKRGNELKIYK